MTQQAVPQVATFLLDCLVEPGVFSHERLIRFTTAAGTEQTALVDQSRVTDADASAGRGWLRVIEAGRSGKDGVLVSLPTADGERIWVTAAQLKQQS